MNNNLRELLEHTFTFDLENGKLFWKNVSKYHSKLNGFEAGNVVATRNNKQYWVIKFNNKIYKRGRLIYFYVYGKFPNPCVDHINGNSLDDRPINLREVTVTQNSWNHKGRKKSNDLPMGIRKNHNKYVARIAVNKKQITIGSFNTVEEAEKQYINYRKKYYGEYSGY